jgi:hypothetical protein
MKIQPLPEPKYVAAIPSGYGKVVGMCEFQGQVIVACEKGVFRLDDGKLVPIEFAK